MLLRYLNTETDNIYIFACNTLKFVTLSIFGGNLSTHGVVAVLFLYFLGTQTLASTALNCEKYYVQDTYNKR